MTQQARDTRLVAVLDQVPSAHVLVVGDLILDRYTWGDAERISEEAPVIVLRSGRQETRLGGAANVCAMLRGLEAQVTCVGVVGQDDAGDVLQAKLDEDDIDHELVVVDSSRPTTVKDRFIGCAGARHPNQILRVDREVRDPLQRRLEEDLIRSIRASVARYDAVLISDYGKGVCTPTLLRSTIDACRFAGVPVLVDPARSRDVGQYRGATLLKPNRTEAELATGCRITTPSDAIRAGARLGAELDLAAVVITLDRDGMAWIPRHGEGRLFATRARSVYDITGAGDIALAVLGLGWAVGAEADDALQLANLASGIKVERAGVSKVTRDEICGELLRCRRPGAQRILQPGQLVEFGVRQREEGRRIVFTNGCFDLLHVGHVTYLAEAASLGDVLVVGLNSDAGVRRLKGPGRPVISQGDRAALLAALACVDAVVIFDEDTPHQLLETLRPDVLVKGGTYTPHEVVGREVVEAYGGRVCVTRVVEGISTTRIVQALEVREQGQEPPPLAAAAGDVLTMNGGLPVSNRRRHIA